jgi:hypothetical protein
MEALYQHWKCLRSHDDHLVSMHVIMSPNLSGFSTRQTPSWHHHPDNFGRVSASCSAVQFSMFFDLHAQKNLGELVYVLTSSMLKKVLKGVVCDNEMRSFFPHLSKFIGRVRFP